MERENLVVSAGAEQRIFGRRQLQPRQQYFDAADQQEDEGGNNIMAADPLMADRSQPSDEARL